MVYLVRDFLEAVQGSDVIQRVYGRGQTSMETEDLRRTEVRGHCLTQIGNVDEQDIFK